ncbi:MAG: DUF5615 family PIN-like protein [Pseudomonadota bacterium]
MKKKGHVFLKQKLKLYFDSNFPKDIVKWLKTDNYWKKKCKIFSAYDDKNQNKDDNFHFNYCKKKRLTLVTLDDDFMDDRKYPFSKMPGIIRVAEGKNDPYRIKQSLGILLNFLSFFPFPRAFMGDTKCQVSVEGCIIRGRDSLTRELKTMYISPGDTVSAVREEFRY